MNLRHTGLLASFALLGLTVGCFEDPISNTDTAGDADSTGDGDGDPTGDGDPSGDGDGDPTGDGDGDPSGDGDGDPSGDGDGDPSGDGDGDGDATGDGDGDAEVVLFDLWELACDAQWVSAPDGASGASLVTCNAGDTGQGSAIAYPFFEVETGATVENALVVAPYQTNDGLISGSYENLDLSGAVAPVLRTGIACPADAQSCDVQWQINARPAGEVMVPIVENGFQSFDGGVDLMIEIDLSTLIEPVDIALVALSNGQASSFDRVVFIHPRIVDAG